jgi:hypothetical protein
MLYPVVRLSLALVLACCLPIAGVRADPIGLEGSWATNSEHCDKVFVRKGGQTVLSEDSDLYGGGFSIDGSRVTGKMARCTITKRKNDGDTVHLLASCATDIMFSSVQFSLRVRDENSITRIFPGMEGIEINYQRCAF